MVANGANNAGRHPPFCCITRRLLYKDNLISAISGSLSLYFLRRTFSSGVNRTEYLSLFCAHLRRAFIRSASPRRLYSSMAFLSFVLLVLFSISRQRTCLFTRPDIAQLTVVSTRNPFYTRPQIARESAHRPLLSRRQWCGPLQQFICCLTQSAHEYEFEASPLLQFSIQQAPTLLTYKSMVFD